MDEHLPPDYDPCPYGCGANDCRTRCRRGYDYPFKRVVSWHCGVGDRKRCLRCTDPNCECSCHQEGSSTYIHPDERKARNLKALENLFQ